MRLGRGTKGIEPGPETKVPGAWGGRRGYREAGAGDGGGQWYEEEEAEEEEEEEEEGI